LARIENIYKNNDGQISKVQIRNTKGNLLHRTVRQIALLESHMDTEVKNRDETRGKETREPLMSVDSDFEVASHECDEPPPGHSLRHRGIPFSQMSFERLETPGNTSAIEVDPVLQDSEWGLVALQPINHYPRIKK
jgi:hypothetical protein